jgi:hypothetical protein
VQIRRYGKIQRLSKYGFYPNGEDFRRTKMFEKFGEFSSSDEINELAENLYAPCLVGAFM